jgi:NADPH:quinone reductase-like Zn-dependent oxidoreductase
MPLNYLTAVSLLERHSQLQQGDTVLIHGASGAVGEALCQLGKLKELTMYGTASAKHRERLEAYGMHFIDYASQDFEKIVTKSEPDGIAAVFDPIGGAYINKSYRLLKKGGVLVNYAFSGSPGNIMADSIKGFLNNLSKRLIPDGKRTDFCSVPEEVRKDLPWYHQSMKTLYELLEQGKIAPTISKIFPL